ncbi:MAG: DUF2723 domain-containing protein [Planctomycetes bacterium]|nr:DUF2723 domain-containing protein [Planctomycetota bacterium]
MGRRTSEGLRLFLLAFSLSLPVYVLTLAPTVSGEDSGELITAAATLGIAHPPGYPLWCLLGKAFTVLVPFGNVAYRVNLCSATLGACAAGVIALLVRRFTRLAGGDSFAVPLGGGFTVPLTAALCFAFSRDFWAQSVVAEVYSLNVLFLALVLHLALLWDDTREPRCLYLLTFAYGLSLTNHSTMGPLGVAIAAYVLWRTPWILRRPLLLLNLVGSVLVGFSIFLYLPIRSLADPPMDWGDPETFAAAARHVLRRQYAGVEGVRPRVLSEQAVLVACFLKDFAMQLTPLLAPLVPIGLWRHWRAERRSCVLLSVLFAASTLGIIWLFNYPAVREDLVVKRTFFIPAYAIAAVWLGLGLDFGLGLALRIGLSLGARTGLGPGLGFRLGIGDRTALDLGPRSGPGIAVRRGPRFDLGALARGLGSKLGSRLALLAAAATPALPLAWHWRENDKSDYLYAEDYARNLLLSLKERAIFIPTSDHSTFPVIYLQEVEGLRRDVLLADRYGGIEDRFLDRLFQDEGRERRGGRLARPPPAAGAPRPEKIRWLVEESRRPVFLTVKEPLGTERFQLAPRGLILEAVPAGHKPDVAELDALWESYRWSEGTFTKAPRDYTADMVLADHFVARARHRLLKGQRREALDDMRSAAAHAWGIKEPLNNIGGELAEQGLAAEAIPYLLAAWEVEPGYPTARRNLAVANEGAGKYAEGLPWFRLQLRETPSDRAILLAAARGAAALGLVSEALTHYFRLARLAGDDAEVLAEVKAFLEKERCSPELIADYGERLKAAEEARKRRHEELVQALEAGQGGAGAPQASGVPSPPLPQVPSPALDPLDEARSLHPNLEPLGPGLPGLPGLPGPR